MFYELNSWDPAGMTPWKRDCHRGELSGAFYGDILTLAKIIRLMDPDAELQHDNGKSKMDLVPCAEIPGYLVPAGYARVFHPQIPMYQLMSNVVVHQIMVEHEARRGNAVWTDNQNSYCNM